MDDTDAITAYGLKAHGEENPTWAQAMRSKEGNHWRDAARAEMQNFEAAPWSLRGGQRGPVAIMELVP
eukprot:4234338-Pleurochrysis_carterae.AAC.1